MATGDELRERELGLLATGERARVLERDIAEQSERAEQGAELRFGEADGLEVVHHGLARDDALVLLRVVARRDAVAEGPGS